MKTLYLDCFCGVSGDMFVGALLDLGADFDALRSSLASLGVTGYTLRAEKAAKRGISATQFSVNVDPDAPQPHRHLRHVVEIIQSGDLPEEVKAAAIETFQHIAECEAEVHGTSVEKVHFHEVGAVDSIVDIVGAHLALYMLDVEQLMASPLNLGGGQVKCAHGVLPVPAPATALLVTGVPSYGSDVPCELTTPTGAALVADVAESFGPMPAMRVERVGYGSGTRELDDRPNVLRAILGETEEGADTEPITVVESNVDDMPPELLAALVSELLEAGARDAFLTPIQCKKGRPGHLINVLCEEAHVRAIMAALFKGSSTLGVRMRRERRVCLAREWKQVRTPWGTVRAKLGYWQGEATVASPEFDDCRALAQKEGVTTREVYEAAFAAAVRGDWAQ